MPEPTALCSKLDATPEPIAACSLPATSPEPISPCSQQDASPAPFYTLEFESDLSQTDSFNLMTSVSPATCPEPVLPGLGPMSLGVDITTLNLFPGDFTSGQKLKAKLFTFTCRDNSKWAHPNQPSRIYSVPDQVSIVNPVSESGLSVNTNFQSSQKEVRESLALTVGIKATDIQGSFSASTGYKASRENILSKKRSIVEVSIC